MFKTVVTPIYLPLSMRPNLAILRYSQMKIISKEHLVKEEGSYFFGPSICTVMAERAKAALSLGGTSDIS